MVLLWAEIRWRWCTKEGYFEGFRQVHQLQSGFDRFWIVDRHDFGVVEVGFECSCSER